MMGGNIRTKLTQEVSNVWWAETSTKQRMCFGWNIYISQNQIKLPEKFCWFYWPKNTYKIMEWEQDGQKHLQNYRIWTKICKETTNLPLVLVPQQDLPSNVNARRSGNLCNNCKRWKTARNKGWLMGRHHIIWWWQWFIAPCRWWDYIKILFYKWIKGSMPVQTQRIRCNHRFHTPIFKQERSSDKTLN